ncbi:hypothetical protein C8R45DRAFT_634873 [Mycena sanguinolenta]|nr:hypothetical protein C8R45DRAFT_634873 [Mycena sanguinolenta]
MDDTTPAHRRFEGRLCVRACNSIPWKILIIRQDVWTENVGKPSQCRAGARRHKPHCPRQSLEDLDNLAAQSRPETRLCTSGHELIIRQDVWIENVGQPSPQCRAGARRHKSQQSRDLDIAAQSAPNAIMRVCGHPLRLHSAVNLTHRLVDSHGLGSGRHWDIRVYVRRPDRRTDEYSVEAEHK